MPDRATTKIKLNEAEAVIPQGGVAALDEVTLSERHARMLADALTCCNGSASWRARKRAEARDLLALAQICGRMVVCEIDLRQTLRALVDVEVPVPLEPDDVGRLRLADHATLGLTYPEEAVRRPQPGHRWVQVLDPVGGVWHPHVAPQGQGVSLGQAPAAVPLSEIIIMAYGVLSMQSAPVMIDERDSAGVMNGRAARWWQQNLDWVPLSREPFLRTVRTCPSPARPAR